MSEDSQNSSPNGDQQAEMLEEHKKMLIMTGKISDFQIKNLKAWPYVLFDGVTKVKIKYDFTEKPIEEDSDPAEDSVCAGRIEYQIAMAGVPDQTRIDTLVEWTKFLFWKDTEVIFDIMEP